MNIGKQNYPRYVNARAPRSAIVQNCIRAFFVGGFICMFGESLNHIYMALGMSKENAGTLCSITLVFVAVLLTGLGVFDKIAKFAGAGTLVPITGFANSVASPAMDSHAEGAILGIGVKIFTVAGPVLLYGTLAGAIYGVIYYLVGILF
ncbi:MAG: stage V sporulation protein AC [Clostridia bacterium]|nr:stage V sporulation protein AC [Clostridia bacterium]